MSLPRQPGAVYQSVRRHDREASVPAPRDPRAAVVIIPPSPVVIDLRGWKLKQPTSPKVPVWRPSYHPPSEQAQSSTTQRNRACRRRSEAPPWRRGSRIDARAECRPSCGRRAIRSRRRSTLNVARSTSEKTGLPPTPVLDDVGRRDPREGRDDDLVARLQTECGDGDLEGCRAGCRRN